MQYIIYCDEGCAQLATRELTSVHGIEKGKGAHITEAKQYVICSGDNDQKIMHTLVRMQTAVHVGLIIGMGSKDESLKQAEAFAWNTVYKEKGTFALKGDEEFIDPLATIMKNKGLVVNLKAPDNLVRITKKDNTSQDEDEWIIAIDFDSQPLVKRDYKVFNNPASLRSSVAAAALMAANYHPGNSIIDPFCGGGTISIEAALFDLKQGSKKDLLKEMKCMQWPLFATSKEDILTHEEEVESQVRGFDHNITAVKSAQKNASIAQVSPQFTRYEAQYLAHTCEEVDHIVTQPPRFSEKDFKGKLGKVLEQFADNAKEVLSENGTLAIITNDSDQLLEAIPFEKPKIYPIHMGKMPMEIVVWERTYM